MTRSENEVRVAAQVCCLETTFALGDGWPIGTDCETIVSPALCCATEFAFGAWRERIEGLNRNSFDQVRTQSLT